MPRAGPNLSRARVFFCCFLLGEPHPGVTQNVELMLSSEINK